MSGLVNAAVELETLTGVLIRWRSCSCVTATQHYGSIVFFDWFSNGMIMIAFSEGYFIVISTKMDVGMPWFGGQVAPALS